MATLVVSLYNGGKFDSGGCWNGGGGWDGPE